MSKPGKKKHGAPNFPPSAMLRPRLDALLNDPTFPQKSSAEIHAALDELARGIKPDFLLPTLIRACLAMSVTSRARLDSVLPEWLHSRNHLAQLGELLAKEKLDYELRGQANAWLGTNAIQLSSPKPVSNELFYQAYDLDNGMQGTTFALWYANEKRNRLYGIGVLYDYHPPWDGAIKDVILFPKLDSREMLRRYVDSWNDHAGVMTPIGASAAKTKILNCLECNRKNKIRLPRDLAKNRDAFWRFVLALPDERNAPKFTDDDWRTLTKQGQSADEIMRYEQTVGRRVRMDDGKELLIMGNPDWEDAV